MMLGPRLGRYSEGLDPLPLGNPVNACELTFYLPYYLCNANVNRTFLFEKVWACSFFGGVGWLLIQDQRMVLVVPNGNMLLEQPL